MVESFPQMNIQSEFVTAVERTDARPSENVPFRVLLVGDWSGRANRGVLASTEQLKSMQPLLVDRDNLDELIDHLGAELELPIMTDGSDSFSVTFNQLDDFHPDRLLERVDTFKALRRTRDRLKNPGTFAEAALEVRGREEPPASDVGVPKDRPKIPNDLNNNILDQILSGGADTTTTSKLSQPTEEVSAEISRLAESAAKPYLTPDISRDQEQLVAQVDRLISSNMNAILHHRHFQALESAWRALDFLVKRLPTGSDLKVYVLDFSFDELKADLKAHQDFRSTATYRWLAEETANTPGGIRWSVIAANYTFDFAAGDQDLVEPISMIAKESGAPFIAGVTPYLLGCDSLSVTPDPDDWRLQVDQAIADRWKTITALPSAEYVGLSLPRFLLRLPYGADTEPTEQFDFEEMIAAKNLSERHETYLWANPSFAIAYLLARGFSEDGWEFRPADYLDIEGLPLHVYERDGDSEVKPCAEVLLTLRAAKKIIDRGLMPLLTMKDSDSIRLGMLQSISGSALRGPWNT